MSFALMFAGLALGVLPEASGAQEAALRFGVLPLGGALESRQDWKPLLDDLGDALGRPVVAQSFTSYEGLRLAMQENRVDLAFVSGKLALEAVLQYGMTVLNQVVRPDGLPGYRSVLIVRKDGPIRDLDDVLNQPGKWRLGLGETQSMSGYVIPQLQLFSPRNIAIERHFPSELVDGHQGTALAVANGDVDVATNNTADLDRFRTHFPQEAARLKIIWESDLIPHGAIVMLLGFSDAMRDKVRTFLSGYGQSAGTRGDAERVVLSRLHGLAGLPPADNRMLLQVLRLEYQLAQRQAILGQWVSEQARQSRLARLAAEYEDQRQRLAPAP
ncbi:phosphate/phosphite/phosphonate ABC transporter substrate-binding protein [Pigmentiphaga sp.]|uniref:phosphate/phosphite/phosphonate ABC transporter substrate-binding protein n=1 Tax=Pigmentiphaga sp. TaxID=1977564 RepID=UPI00128B6FE2|nr:phosphate/phosphite/phosphonate ABC transporter substrate-binding protein [Pigmentiphaga sp.]MPS27873.1 phosphate/phosphite/phosphonate ABC transporter substrate-binding protein [Alcaligenaceae bacterium SAGV5]MPS50948.1 phosphate/phosphite/phosphonate ABC transporter substrate-binding protein [Alcaligenaceae bacterium SAGV3]MPT55765.1 phosphate/phosphite/phosphonate ABC transporter substrate-binding protein [Alcaligenaceae bacterium]